MFGLSFANPGMLYGLFAALLPLAIHLLNRRRTTTVPFSNVALLQVLQHDRMRRVKLKQILLLILRGLVKRRVWNSFSDAQILIVSRID